MRRTELEPGLLQVFRIYVWLRLASLLVLPLIGQRARLELQVDLSATLVWMGVENVLLLGYLYWSSLPSLLGRYYIPIGLAFASSALIIEQHFFLPYRTFWQLAPYLYILLILVAWQYDYREVVVFALGTALFEVALFLFAPPLDVVSLPRFSDTLERVITFGLLFSRSVSFLVLGYVVTRLVSAQRSQRRALAEANQKLVRHAATLEQLAVSRERIRLSRELHDTLAHTLSALVVQIEAVVTVWEEIPAKAREVLERMLLTTRSGLDETRRALSALRASPLEEMGLALALRTLVQDFANRHALALEMDVPEDLEDLSPEVEQCYYRVAQEALENIARHADAQRLCVRMERDSGGLSLSISDDGRGFDPRQAAGEVQLGLRGIRERAELIGANLVVESQSGEGTTLRLELGGAF